MAPSAPASPRLLPEGHDDEPTVEPCHEDRPDLGPLEPAAAAAWPRERHLRPPLLRGERGKLGGGPGDESEIGPLERVVLDREGDEPLPEMHDVVPARNDGRAQLGREPWESLARLASAAATETGPPVPAHEAVRRDRDHRAGGV